MLMKPKSMKLLISILFLLSACTSSKPGSRPADDARVSNLGTVDGGGGKGVKCAGRTRTLDLYEAEEIRRLPVVRTNAAFDDVLWDRAFALMKHLSEDDVEKYKTDPRIKPEFDKEFRGGILDRFVYLAPGTRLALTKDAHVPALPSDCEEIQIAVYAKDDKIYVDQDYWSKLTSDDQVALVLHEYVYHRARKYGALDSDESREVIGDIFADQDPLPMFEPLWKRTDYLYCIGGGSTSSGPQPIFEFYAANDTISGVSGVSLYFRAVSGEYVLNRAASFLPGLTTDMMHEDSTGQWARSFTVWRRSHPSVNMDIETEAEMCKTKVVGNHLKVRTWETSSAKPAFSNISCIRQNQTGRPRVRQCGPL